MVALSLVFILLSRTTGGHVPMCRAFARAELHSEVAQAASSSTSDGLHGFLSGLHFEARKGFKNIQVYARFHRMHASGLMTN